MAESQKYNSDNKWLSVGGVVFDVKSAEQVCESMYGDFPDAIGHDISYALGKYEFKKAMYNKSIKKPNKQEESVSHKGDNKEEPSKQEEEEEVEKEVVVEEEGLTKEEKIKLKKYFRLFLQTYPIVGLLKDEEKKYNLPKFILVTTFLDVNPQEPVINTT